MPEYGPGAKITSMENTQNLENEIKKIIIESLNLEDYSIGDIKNEEPLFVEGLGLDSIDALELGIAVKKEFDINLDVDSDIKKHFYSVDTLASFIRSFKDDAEVTVAK